MLHKKTEKFSYQKKKKKKEKKESNEFIHFSPSLREYSTARCWYKVVNSWTKAMKPNCLYSKQNSAQYEFRKAFVYRVFSSSYFSTMLNTQPNKFATETIRISLRSVKGDSLLDRKHQNRTHALHKFRHSIFFNSFRTIIKANTNSKVNRGVTLRRTPRRILA
jgi:hypothetical protein